MKTNGTFTVEYIRSNEREDVFLITGPSTHHYESFERDQHTEDSVLATLPDSTDISKVMGVRV